MVSSNLDKGIAFQIRATRNAREWKQSDLAEAAGMSPNNISRIESEDYGKQTLTSLKRIAEAFDVALVVRLVPFSQYIDWLSGTPFLDEGIRPEALAVPSFNEEERTGNQQIRYWKVTPGVSILAGHKGGGAVKGIYQSPPIPIQSLPIVSHGSEVA
jgi:transcriptional regulator with XRE-family HTH domain